MNEIENNTPKDIWDEVHIGHSQDKIKNSLVLKKYNEKLYRSRIDNLMLFMSFFGFLFLFYTFSLWHVFRPFHFQNDGDLSLAIIFCSICLAYFFFTLGKAYGQKRIIGPSPGYIKFHRRITVALWIYIIGWWCVTMNSNMGDLIFLACTGMAILLFLNGQSNWQCHKHEIYEWKDAPENIGFIPSGEYKPYRFLIFEKGNDARLFEYRGNIRKLGLVYKFPYEEKQDELISKLLNEENNDR